jgi:hypothetical protein
VLARFRFLCELSRCVFFFTRMGVSFRSSFRCIAREDICAVCLLLMVDDCCDVWKNPSLNFPFVENKRFLSWMHRNDS